MAELPFMPVAKRGFKYKPMRVNTAQILADASYWSNERFGRYMRAKIARWQRLNRVVVRRGGLSCTVKRAVFDRDGAVCKYCGDLNGPYEIDHIVAVKLGGSDDLENLCVACKRCNRRKSDMPLSDWLVRQ